MCFSLLLYKIVCLFSFFFRTKVLVLREQEVKAHSTLTLLVSCVSYFTILSICESITPNTNTHTNNKKIKSTDVEVKVMKVRKYLLCTSKTTATTKRNIKKEI